MRFLYSRDTWRIEYQDDEGKARTKVSGLAPPKTDLAGENLSKQAYADAMVQFRRKAMSMWNALDKSDRPRFDLTEDA